MRPLDKRDVSAVVITIAWLATLLAAVIAELKSKEEAVNEYEWFGLAAVFTELI